MIVQKIENLRRFLKDKFNDLNDDVKIKNKFKIVLDDGSKYDDNSVTFKITVEDLESTGGQSLDEYNWNKYIKYYEGFGLKKSDLGAEFIFKGKKCKIVGLEAYSKYPVKCVKDDGSITQFKVGAVVGILHPEFRSANKNVVKISKEILKETSVDLSKYVKKHIDDIHVGDIIRWDNDDRTVGKNDIKRGGFHGTTIFGDSFRSGMDPILVLKVPNWNKGKVTWN